MPEAASQRTTASESALSVVAGALAVAGSLGLGTLAFVVAERWDGRVGPVVWLVAGLLTLTGMVLWITGAAVFARCTGRPFSTALRFDAWTYAPLMLLYLPTLRPELPIWPAAAGAVAILSGKFLCYRVLPWLSTAEAAGRLWTRERVAGLVASGVIAVYLASLLTADSFQSGTLLGNLSFMLTRPEASYVDRLGERGRGHYAAFFTFVREATPPDAVVLIPPGVGPWYAEADLSLALAALWPRRVREAASFDLGPADLEGVTHILVTVVEGKPRPDAPAAFRWPRVMPPGELKPYQGGPWGVIDRRGSR